jgi:serine/threonine-protein kinase HipA
MKTAARLGIDVASVRLNVAEDQVFLLVQRYDRHRNQNTKKVERIHQEDFCQALAIFSKQKYEEDGGPTLPDCFNLLDKTVLPAGARLNLVRATVFNFLVGNMGAHAKNFSLLHTTNGIRFAPMYDVICTLAFPDFSRRLAMGIGDTRNPEEIFAFQWRTLCEDIGFSYPAFKKLAKRLYSNFVGEAVGAYAEMQSAGWSHPACERALQIFQANFDQMKNSFDI